MVWQTQSHFIQLHVSDSLFNFFIHVFFRAVGSTVDYMAQLKFVNKLDNLNSIKLFTVEPTAAALKKTWMETSKSVAAGVLTM